MLVVDDNEDAATALGEVLLASGCATMTVHDAAKALALAPEFRPDIAVLDIGLPGMSGWELAEALRADGGASPPHCIAVTGCGVEGDLAKSRAAEFVAHLVQPLDIERLQRILAGLAASREPDAA